MDTNSTELVFIVDRSGSMSGLEGDTIGGFNSTLAKQKELSGECRVTTVLFDHEYEVLHDRLDLCAVSPITAREYYIRGNTALLDAIGRTIAKIDNVQKNQAEEHRAGRVLFVIITDGEENASYEYDYKKIKSKIERRKEKYGWEFLFLGANMDAIKAANRLGISRNRARNYRNDSMGISKSYAAVCCAVSDYRSAPVPEGMVCSCDMPTFLREAISDDWGDEVEKDYRERSLGEDGDEASGFLSKAFS